MEFSGTEEIKCYIYLWGQQINVLNVTLCTFHALFPTSQYQVCLCRICSGQDLLELIFLDFFLELASQFVHSFIINHYDLCLISDVLYHVLLSGDVRVMSQQPLSSSSPTIRMPFTLTSHPTSMPPSHHPAHRMQHHPTHYPLGSQSSSSEMSIGSGGRPPKPRKQRWVGNKIWIL